MLHVPGPGQPVWSYTAIHGLYLPLLGLGVHGKDQAAHQDLLWPALGQKHVIKSPKAPKT